MLIFHRTNQPDHILSNGFQDGQYDSATEETLFGVKFSTDPLDLGNGGEDDFILMLDIPSSLFEQHEQPDEQCLTRNVRMAIIPAQTVNSYGLPKVLTQASATLLAETLKN